MIRSATARIALLAAICAALLLVPAGATAARSSARASTCSARGARHARACAQARRHKARRTHASHRRKHARRTSSASTGIATRVAPVCENGAKLTLSAGSPGCSDGGEPQCATGTTPVLTAAGAVLYCTPDTLPGEEECGTEGTPSCSGSTSSSPAAPACEDGTDATLDLEGVYACDDGSEPRCGEGFALSISEAGTSLVCEPATQEPAGSGSGSGSES
jgi:hypothetical protein